MQILSNVGDRNGINTKKLRDIIQFVLAATYKCSLLIAFDYQTRRNGTANALKPSISERYFNIQCEKFKTVYYIFT